VATITQRSAYGTGFDVGELCRSIRTTNRGLPVLHIGSDAQAGLPADVSTLSGDFNADTLLSAVGSLIHSRLMTADSDLVSYGARGGSYPKVGGRKIRVRLRGM
jgi:hypothetical protein